MAIRPIYLALHLLLASMGVIAQQPNAPGLASMEVNGNSGPPYPIRGVSLLQGATANVAIRGTPNSPFVLFGGPSLLPVGDPIASLGGELLDIDLNAGYGILLDGSIDPTANTTGSGQWTGSFVVPNSITPGTTVGFQSLIAAPGAPTARLTAATEVTVWLGTTVVPFQAAPTGANGAVFDLTAYGSAFPFYGSAYNQLFIYEDGFVSFGALPAFGFPQIGPWQSADPRIAASWNGLDTQAPGASVNVTIDPTLSATPFTTVTVNWVSLATFGLLSRQTFSVRLTPATGEIQMSWDGFESPGVFDATIVGITPGNNIFPSNPGTGTPGLIDLSMAQMTPFAGQPQSSLWEFFGTQANPWYPFPAPASTPWDLAGQTLTFTPTAPGTANAAYTVN